MVDPDSRWVDLRSGYFQLYEALAFSIGWARGYSICSAVPAGESYEGSLQQTKDVVRNDSRIAKLLLVTCDENIRRDMMDMTYV